MCIWSNVIIHQGSPFGGPKGSPFGGPKISPPAGRGRGSFGLAKAKSASRCAGGEPDRRPPKATPRPPPPAAVFHGVFGGAAPATAGPICGPRRPSVTAHGLCARTQLVTAHSHKFNCAQLNLCNCTQTAGAAHTYTSSHRAGALCGALCGRLLGPQTGSTAGCAPCMCARPRNSLALAARRRRRAPFVTEGGLRALLLAGARKSVCRSFDRLYRKSFARAPAHARLARAAARWRTWEDLRKGLHIYVGPVSVGPGRAHTYV